MVVSETYFRACPSTGGQPYQPQWWGQKVKLLPFPTSPHCIRPGRHYLDRPSLLRAFALGFVEDFLAQAQVLRRGFDVFVRTDVFQRAFQTELERRIELNAFAVPLRTHVGELFRLARVDRNVVVTSVFADDHASVDFVARFDH